MSLRSCLGHALFFYEIRLFSCLYAFTKKVIYECFPSFDSIIVQNPKGDAWVGEIRVTKVGLQEDLSLSCSKGCTGSKFNGKIVVDGIRGEKIAVIT